VAQIAALTGIDTVALDAEIPMPITSYGSSTIVSSGSSTIVSFGTSTAPGWNVTALRAPDLWNLGYTGQGVVVANMDTGVLASHPSLTTRYRGGTNSWKDVTIEHYAAPTDIDGHGTMTMGLMVAGSEIGAPLGAAPGAKWIAVKIAYRQTIPYVRTVFDLSSVHAAFQWLLDPDNNPATNDAPDVVNASWGLSTIGCDAQKQFLADIQALKAANIAIVFAAGNFGTSGNASPQNYAESFSVGSVDVTYTIEALSSRGPFGLHRQHLPECCKRRGAMSRPRSRTGCMPLRRTGEHPMPLPRPRAPWPCC